MVKYEQEIENWKPLITKLADKYKNKILPYTDLINEGIIGLIDALNTYTEDKGHINGFIKNKIRKQMHNAAINSSFAVHVPSGSMQLFYGKPEQIKKMKGFHISDCAESYYNSYLDEMIDIKDIIKQYDKSDIAKMYFLDSMNYEEISQVAKTSISTISRHINLVRDIIIRKCL